MRKIGVYANSSFRIASYIPADESWLFRTLRGYLPRDWFDDVENVDLTNCEISGDAVLVKLKALNKLNWLSLDCTNVADKDLVHIKELTELQTLDLDRTSITDAGLVHLNAARILYLSCDPPTLARDLRAMQEAGYRVARLQGYDMFPQTMHIETLVELARRA